MASVQPIRFRWTICNRNKFFGTCRGLQILIDMIETEGPIMSVEYNCPVYLNTVVFKQKHYIISIEMLYMYHTVP